MSRETSEIQNAASAWVAQRDSGHWSSADEVRLQARLAVSTLHRVEFLRIRAAWDETRRVKALAGGTRSDRPPAPGQWKLSPFFELGSGREGAEPLSPGIDLKDSRPRTASAGARWALAACALLIVTGGFVTWRLWPAGQQYSTPVGGIASVPMADGSQVVLNTNSEILIALGPSERHVDLERGEAFFEVARDPKRPFVVEAGKKRIVAVGTQFSVRRYGDAIQVVVTEGKVRMEDVSAPLTSPSVESPSGSPEPESANGPVFLTPGTVARADGAGVLIQRGKVREAEAELSWRSGILSFRDETLADAIAEFNRYNRRKVVIDDPAAAGLRIEGNFRANNIAAFLDLLQKGYPVRVVEEDDRTLLTAK